MRCTASVDHLGHSSYALASLRPLTAFSIHSSSPWSCGWPSPWMWSISPFGPGFTAMSTPGSLRSSGLSSQTICPPLVRSTCRSVRLASRTIPPVTPPLSSKVTALHWGPPLEDAVVPGGQRVLLPGGEALLHVLHAALVRAGVEAHGAALHVPGRALAACCQRAGGDVLLRARVDPHLALDALRPGAAQAGARQGRHRQGARGGGAHPAGGRGPRPPRHPSRSPSAPGLPRSPREYWVQVH